MLEERLIERADLRNGVRLMDIREKTISQAVLLLPLRTWELADCMHFGGRGG